MQITPETPVLSSKLVEPVSTSQVGAALALLGIEVPVDDVVSVHMEGGAVEVVVYVRDEQGKLVLAGMEAAKVSWKAPVFRG